MERSEPSLVPEWLRGTGSGPGGGNSTHQYASSQSGRCLSSNSRRSSNSNGLTKNDKNFTKSYTSFTRNHRDREKERYMVSDHWDHDYSDPLRNILSGRIEKDPVRHFQSMVPRMQGEVFPQRQSTNSSGDNLSNNSHVNGLYVGDMAGIQKVSFEKDFPSLGSDELPTSPATPELCRVPSPGLIRAFQGLPTFNSVVTAGDSWASDIAEEVPKGAVNSNTGSLSALQPAPSTSDQGASNATTVLNMAEALVQTPLRSPSSQSPTQIQRFEELAVIQSKRLIPMTPSMPKSSILNPLDKLKSKPKAGPRSSDPAIMPKNGNIRVEGPKASLTVLKSGRENGVPPASKDVPSPKANVNNRHVTFQPTGAPPVAKILCAAPTNWKLAGERKAQAQSRSDFFNSVRKKSMNSTSVSADSSTFLSSAIAERLDGEHKDVASDPVSPTTENGGIVKCSSDARSMTHVSLFAMDEEGEFALLQSLGWEPGSGVNEDLTFEEMSEFYEKYKEVLPTLKCEVVQEVLAAKLEETFLNGRSS